MANDLNRCEFIGRAGKDPELRHTQGGDPVANFSIAVGETYKDRNGEKSEKTTWVPVVIWGKLAEIAGKYVERGSLVYVAGKFVVRKWQDKDGSDKYTTEINANQLQLLSYKKR